MTVRMILSNLVLWEVADVILMYNLYPSDSNSLLVR